MLLAVLGGGATCIPAADWPGGEKVDAAVRAAIRSGLTPGAVVWIESRGARLHYAHYGSRSVEPERQPMTLDTVFDCASLTKVMATAPAVMMLVEEGKVRLNDRIQAYLPDFEDSTRITVQQLLTHYSGLRAGLDLEADWAGYSTGVDLALREKPIHPPGSRFLYSDINYILLAEIVRRTSGVPVDQFASERIFEPLGMRHTLFRPPAAWLGRIAPTERLADGSVLRGDVHDPTTRRMGGVSGQAGLFSTAADVARFARMMLGGGEMDGARILSPLSVLRMRTPQSPPGLAARGLGWDIDTPYSSPRGDLFSKASYGHTGFTGPSLWIDPVSESFVVLMTNRVHPRGGTSVVRLRSLVASIAAANIDFADEHHTKDSRRERQPATTQFSQVSTGLDTLVGEGFSRLEGQAVGLITNQTGVDRLGRRNIDLMAAQTGFELKRIFSPEHGIDGLLDQDSIGDGRDRATGLPVVSLYRENRRKPTAQMLEGLDALVFDIQDVGARFYTYITTMAYALEAAADAGIPFYVLDRPNPVNGTTVAGPVLDSSLESFVGYHSLPVRHGMTVGELASMFNEERGLRADLRVVTLSGWQRSQWFDETGLPWVNPSPNIRSVDQAILYPGIALLEWLPDYSVGRGTDAPFQFIGADWVQGSDLAEALRRLELPGVRIYQRKLRPKSSVYQDQTVHGIQFSIADRNRFQPVQLGLAIATALQVLGPERLDLERCVRLLGSQAVVDSIKAGRSLDAILDQIRPQLDEFRARRQRFLLY